MHCRQLLHKLVYTVHCTSSIWALAFPSPCLFYFFFSPSSLLPLLVVIRIWLILKHRHKKGKLMHYLLHHRWQHNLAKLSVCSVVPGNSDDERELNFFHRRFNGPIHGQHLHTSLSLLAVICNYSIQINSFNCRWQEDSTTATATVSLFAGSFSIYKWQFQPEQRDHSTKLNSLPLCLPSSSLPFFSVVPSLSVSCSGKVSLFLYILIGASKQLWYHRNVAKL